MLTTDRPRLTTRTIEALALAIALGLAPGFTLAHDNHANHAQQGVGDDGKGYTRVESRYVVPDVELIDANGARVSLQRELESGRPVILNFIFTTCTAICPVMSATLSEAQGALDAQKNAVRIISISIDPEHDTPARLKAYAESHRAGPNWHLLTGSKQSILTVARAFGAWRGEKMNHNPATYLRGAAGNTWVRLDGFATPSELLREYGALVGVSVASGTR